MVDGNVSTVTVCQNSLGDVPLKRRTLASPGSVAADRCGRATALWQKCREHSLHAVSLARVCGILAGLAGDFVSAGLLCKRDAKYVGFCRAEILPCRGDWLQWDAIYTCCQYGSYNKGQALVSCYFSLNVPSLPMSFCMGKMLILLAQLKPAAGSPCVHVVPEASVPVRVEASFLFCIK